MKLIALSSRVALTAFAAFVLGLALDVQPLALFAFASAALFLLVVAGDYAPQAAPRRVHSATIVPFTPLTPAAPVDERLAA